MVGYHKRQLLLSSTSGALDRRRRNQNYLDILRLLSLGDKQLSSFDISLRFTHLFWLGDLNYRLDMDIQVGQANTAQACKTLQSQHYVSFLFFFLSVGDFKLH